MMSLLGLLHRNLGRAAVVLCRASLGPKDVVSGRDASSNSVHYY